MRVPVDETEAVDVASVDRGEPVTTSLIINRGPNSVYVSFDTDATADDGAEIKLDDFVSRKMGRGQRISAICAAGETATLHVLSDPEE